MTILITQVTRLVADQVVENLCDFIKANSTENVVICGISHGMSRCIVSCGCSDNLRLKSIKNLHLLIHRDMKASFHTQTQCRMMQLSISLKSNEDDQK